MKYYRENQDIIIARMEKKRLEQELMLLRIMEEAQKRLAEWRAKVSPRSTVSDWEMESNYIEHEFKIIR